MLHSCSFPSCDTRTLSTYCWEHDVLIRSEIEAERDQAAVRDYALARELAELNEPAPAHPRPPVA